MKSLSFAIAVLLMIGTAAPQHRPQGMFSRSATPIWDLMWNEHGNARQVRIPAPDRSQMLIAKAFEKGEDTGVQLSLRRGDATIWKERITPGVGIEAKWSPDSQAFFVTTSDAGRNGWYRTLVYLLSDGKVTKIDVSPLVLKAFGHPVKCGWEEDPNVAGVRWLTPSKSLLVAAEIIGHSNCDSYGTFRAYEVSLPEGARIVKIYGQVEAKRLFRTDLGWELIHARDNCIRNPKSCRVAANHSAAND